MPSFQDPHSTVPRAISATNIQSKYLNLKPSMRTRNKKRIEPAGSLSVDMIRWSLCKESLNSISNSLIEKLYRWSSRYTWPSTFRKYANQMLQRIWNCGDRDRKREADAEFGAGGRRRRHHSSPSGLLCYAWLRLLRPNFHRRELRSEDSTERKESVKKSLLKAVVTRVVNSPRRWPGSRDPHLGKHLCEPGARKPPWLMTLGFHEPGVVELVVTTLGFHEPGLYHSHPLRSCCCVIPTSPSISSVFYIGPCFTRY